MSALSLTSQSGGGALGLSFGCALLRASGMLTGAGSVNGNDAKSTPEKIAVLEPDAAGENTIGRKVGSNPPHKETTAPEFFYPLPVRFDPLPVQRGQHGRHRRGGGECEGQRYRDCNVLLHRANAQRNRDALDLHDRDSQNADLLFLRGMASLTTGLLTS
ncbi:hypothetical protein CHEID_02565 [Corynebacterium heidelbergense]|uniref:Uncharacterized protein n=1 Tax=Corynebacterium heidelbergense TaxID=2055947 RepID=A0A364VE67_9CORY|nr:hypothetical protein CWC39_00965 [Corynebacterium heidelbergense]WCZ36078.1 hypothetical protein CHEID_02565 [Corynebacterium heidelbergense]